MRKEHFFTLSLAVLAIFFFTFGSKLGLALQNSLRGGVLVGNNGAAGASGQTASVSDSLDGANAAGASPASTTITSAVLVRGGVDAPVYSQYPFNLKNQLNIAAGSAQGIAVGDAAVSNGNLIGVITSVSKNSSAIQTLFDGGFQMPVRIGTSGTDSLLKGGVDPALTLIPNGAAVNEGDTVYSAQTGMPYALPLGTLHALHDAADKVFQEASLAVTVNPANLEQVTVLTSGQ